MRPLNILKKELFSKTNTLQFQKGVQGQYVDPDGIICIGDRAGPECHISSLCHELAHFVEIDDYRVTWFGWGLKLPQIWVYDRMCIEPTTIQITDREIRVAAYQKNLLDYLKVDYSVEKLVESYTWLPDFHLVPLEDGLPAYINNGENEKSELRVPYEEIDLSRLRYIRNRVNDILSEFSIERFFSEFDRKVKIIG